MLFARASSLSDSHAVLFAQHLGNILLFLPLGVMLPLLHVRFRSLKTLLITAVCLSLSIEIIQFALRLIGSARSVDIDDVLLNTLGACLGYALVRIVASEPVVSGQCMGSRQKVRMRWLSSVLAAYRSL